MVWLLYLLSQHAAVFIYLLQVLPAGVLGLLVAGLLAAMMSTFDGYLLCWSSVIVRDIIMPLSNRTWSHSKQLRWIRYFIVFILLCGVFMLYWGLFYQGSEDVWDYLAITGAIYFTGAIPVMIGGLYWQRASNVGALLSLLCWLFCIIWLGTGATGTGDSFVVCRDWVGDGYIC